MKTITSDELWAIYKTLPKKIQIAIFSEDTFNAVTNISRLYDIDEHSPISEGITHVLSGLLPPNMFIETIQEKLKIKPDTAKKIGMEIEHLIFNPIKKELDKLYKTESAPIEAQQEDPDSYRETLE